MAQFQELDQRVNPYSQNNVFRSQYIQTPTDAHLLSNKSRNPGLTIIVLNLDKPDLVRQLWSAFTTLASKFINLCCDIEFLIGDTGSTNSEVLHLYDNPPPNTKIYFGLQYQFSQCNNQLFTKARYDTVLFLNNDVIISDNYEAIINSYDCLHRQSFEVLGTVLLFENLSVQHAGIDYLTDEKVYGLPYHPGAGTPWQHRQSHTWEVKAVTGAFLMIKADLFESVDGFDEIYQAECQDVDLCLKVHRLGKRIGMCDVGPLVHLENATRPKGEENWRDRSIFIRRWSTYLESCQ